ncbi:MAG: hypothetical protein QOE65_2032 [Solirubrobacteraceae bacterium]|jgi:hypothetical protein|nr:hypothetical protein [Solirubrobacteraceae bacterium]
MLPRREVVAVVGGGVGALIALELADLGYDVVILDEQTRLLAGATGRHGRRLHLGEHYSGDAEFTRDRINTAQRCMLGALALVRRWPQVAPRPGRWWQFITDTSMTSPKAYLEFLAEVRNFHHALRDAGLDEDMAFGPPEARHRRLAFNEYSEFVDTRRVVLAMESVEPVLDAAALHSAVMAELHARADRISVRCRHRVLSIRAVGEEYALEARGPEGNVHIRADHVVNAAWHGMRHLSAGVAPDDIQITARLRLMAVARIPAPLASLPSMYFHRGVHGNHTNVGRGQALVLAETVSNLHHVDAPTVPEGWRGLLLADADDAAWVRAFAAYAGQPSTGGEGAEHAPHARAAALLAELASIASGRGTQEARAAMLRSVASRAILTEYGTYVPEFAAAQPIRLVPNVVMSMGDAGLWDPSSMIHRRDALVRPRRRGFVDVLTGKLTYAILVAQEAAAHVLSSSRGEPVDRTREIIMSPVVRRAWQPPAVEVPV